ncbi:unnamed protein product [Rotaria sordida]|uniref:E2 ubiquitin-conjugating enzyme n=2 Tax=Rotaria sordida TaxID=392033 RepID=A0A819PKR4_9BILA|nr:unnamed protein product [Rotaria sordida]CAF1440164.1 unnamed protein product [Rotaria sordida]CAF1457883.1 unnamed protein product [Rotaria sordida]CAF3943547.1 unnamed protein product [Rotaria sordida]CAF4015989.1 unnamed protein product [Rotaria sordida]
MAFLKRLRLHYLELKKDPPPLCHAEPEDPEKDLTHWIGYIDGPEHTQFAGGRFHLIIDFPADFPFTAPDIRFTTPIYHPNISTKGEICLDILHSQWSPALSIRALLVSLCSLLSDPNLTHGLNKDALKLYQTDQRKYEEIIREWTREYAGDRSSLK